MLVAKLMLLNVLLSLLLCHWYVYEPIPPVGVEPVICAASPLLQKVIVAGAVNVFVRSVVCTFIVTAVLVLEHAPLVTILL